ncbi:MAG TPA: PepSY-associated TM helix domain-containing protein [Polyangiaceae bacterium]|nr:PepSY-associated TM helix domain-containing protein [Polyangiaceae bacterium]
MKWRPLLRALHRDTGYVAVGLTFVYATSGLAVNHVADWDPNFHNTSETHEIGGPLPEDDAAAGAKVTEALGIREAPKEVYREGDELEVLFEHRTLHVTAATGHVVDEQQKPRFFVRAANWLHLNRGKKGWTYFADSYAVGLLFLATSGLFMLSGKKGFFGRGAVLVAIGVAAPLAYMLAVRG